MLELISDYSGPQLAICCVGAGSHFLALPKYPGVSAILHTVHSPYSTSALREYIESSGILFPESSPFVSEQMLDALVRAAQVKYPNCVNLVLTGAVSSLRKRKGLDHCWWAITHPDKPKVIEYHHFEFEKPAEPFPKTIHAQIIARGKQELVLRNIILEALLKC